MFGVRGKALFEMRRMLSPGNWLRAETRHHLFSPWILGSNGSGKRTCAFSPDYKGRTACHLLLQNDTQTFYLSISLLSLFFQSYRKSALDYTSKTQLRRTSILKENSTSSIREIQLHVLPILRPHLLPSMKRSFLYADEFSRGSAQCP